MVQPERRFLGVPVKHPLPLGIVHALAGELVLQLDGHHRDAVHGQHHVHTVVVLPGVVPLADTLADVLAVVLDGHIVQGGLRLEIAHPELDPPVLEPVAQDADQAVVLHRVFKGLVKLLLRIGAALLLEPLPLDGLGGLDKAHQGVQVQGHAGVHGGPVARVRGLLPATDRGGQKGLDILFKLLFVVRHFNTSRLSAFSQ